MDLGFSQKITKGTGKNKWTWETNFVAKIWQSFDEYTFNNSFDSYSIPHKELTGKYIEGSNHIRAKRHTIRKPRKGKKQWAIGDKIHFVINSRTKNRFQFAPVLMVKAVQRIEIKHYTGGLISVKIDEKVHDVVLNGHGGIQECSGFMSDTENWACLWTNDGFDSVEDFFKWFDTDFEGYVIHWTDLKY